VDTTENSPLSVQSAGPVPEKAPASFLRQLKKQAKTELRLAALGSLLSVVGLVGICWSIALIIDAAATEQTTKTWWWGLAALGLLLRYAANLFRDRMSQTLSARIRSRLRTKLLHTASRLGPFGLAAQGNAAWWAHQYLEQIDALHGYLARYLPARLGAAIVPLSIIVVVFWVDWVAGFLLLLATPIIPIFMMLIGWGTESIHQSQQEKQAVLASHLLERLEALSWLRRQGAIEQTALDVEVAADQYRRTSMRVLRVAFLSSATLEFFSAISIGLLAIYIGFALVGIFTFGPAVDLSLSTGLFILLLAPECFLPLRQMAQAHHDMSAAKAASQGLASWLAEPVDSHEQSNQPEPIAHTSATVVDARGLSFRFSDESPDLYQNLSLTIASGEMVAISGPSGSGKSTLLALIAGFLSPSQGKVARTKEWSWLSQRPYLFHETLRSNLLMSKQETVPDDQLLVALNAAGLPLPDPALPDGLDTKIGEQNRGVSGGQAQRIALARALLKGSRLWILDEPTAALDESTRDDLIETLVALSRRLQVAVLIASHDEALLRACDRVISLPMVQTAPSTDEVVVQ
jgi:ATP-binding cassette subfamily C protein CydD